MSTINAIIVRPASGSNSSAKKSHPQNDSEWDLPVVIHTVEPLSFYPSSPSPLESSLPSSTVISLVPATPAVAVEDSAFLESSLAKHKVEQPVTLRFEDINVTMLQKSGFAGINKKITTKPLVQSVSGVAKPGRLLAIMGGSGAGKTTLLNTVCGQYVANSQRRITGRVSLNSITATSSLLSKLCGFVNQDDIFLPSLTVREIITFSALMRLPAAMSEEDKHARVEEIISLLGLRKCADTRVGTATESKISGGERRRLSCAVELITLPAVIFLDEPTSGLDAVTSFALVGLLRALAHQCGHTVVATIHQPSARTFFLFDDLLLLHGGKVAYQGEVGKALEYFEEKGFRCPTALNPIDFLIKVVAKKSETFIQTAAQPPKSLDTVEEKTDKEARANFKLAADNANGSIELTKLSSPPSSAEKASSSFEEDSESSALPSALAPPSWWAQFYLILLRSLMVYVRNPKVIVAKAMQNAILACFVGLLGLALPNSQEGVHGRMNGVFFGIVTLGFATGSSVVLTFSPERPLVLREHERNFYHISAYFFGRTAIDFVEQFVFPMVYASVFYWLMHTGSGEAGQFFLYYLAVIIFCHCISGMALFLSAVAPNNTVAMQLLPNIIIPFMLVSGYFSNLATLANWLVWWKDISIHQFILQAMWINEFQGVTFYCTADELVPHVATDGTQTLICPVTSGDSWLDSRGIDTTMSGYWQALGWGLLITVVWRVIAFWSLKRAVAKK